MLQIDFLVPEVNLNFDMMQHFQALKFENLLKIQVLDYVSAKKLTDC